MKAEGYLKLKSDREIIGCATEGQGRPVVLTVQAARRIGSAFAHLLARRLKTTPDKMVIAVGHDARKSSPQIAQALIQGLTDADCDVLDCGLCTTPAVFCTLRKDMADGAVMVTASHHAWYDNGFKMAGRDGSFSEEEVTELLLEAQNIQPAMRLVKPCNIREQYLLSLRQMVEKQLDTDVQCPLLGLHVVVDAGGGAGGFYARFLEELGCEVTGSMGLEEDGMAPVCTQAFDNPKALEAISRRVTENTADVGVLLDAEGDRAVLVDDKGRIINGNRLIALICAVLLEERPGAAIVTDSVTSSGLQRFITEWGGVHYRFKRGYQNVIREAVRLNGEGIYCPLAIETSGHTAFLENDFLDDGLYMATRLLCYALVCKREGRSFGDLIHDLSEPVERTELRLEVLEDDLRSAVSGVIQTILSHTLQNPAWHLAVDNREGVRILFDLEGGVENAWFQLRLSLHDPVLALNAESDVPGGVKYMLSQLYALIGKDKNVDLTLLKQAAEG